MAGNGGLFCGGGLATIALLLVALLVSSAHGQAGTFNLQFQTATIQENTGSLTVLVFRTGGTSGDVSVAYTTMDGSAVAGQDYIANNGVLNFGSGISAQSIVIGIIDDSSYEVDEVFFLILANATGGAVIGPSDDLASITIAASDRVPGTISILDSSYSVAESAGSVTVRVGRIGGVDGAVSVAFNTFDNQALAGQDYTAVSGVLAWANGDSSTQSIVIAILDDAIYEPDESFEVVLSNPINTTIARDTVKVVIQTSDQQAGAVSFTVANISVSEDIGQLFLSVTRTGGADGVVSVNVSATPASALTPQDFTLVTKSLSWDNGDALAKTVAVQILNDGVYEQTDNFRVSLFLLAGGVAAGPIQSVLVSIIDDDQLPGLIAFNPKNYTVAEEAGTVSVFLTRTGGSDGDVAATVKTASLEAIAGSDFVSVNTVVTFANGEVGPKVVVVSIIDDSVFELEERFAMSLSNPVGGAQIDAVNAIVTIQRSDQRAGVVSFVQTFVQVSESAGAVLLEIVRTSPYSDGAITAFYSTQDGTAVGAIGASGDYVISSGSVSWGDKENGTRRVFVLVTDDTVFEEDEQFSLKITSVTGGATVLADTVTIVILRNDENYGVIAFAPNGPTCDVCNISVPESVGTFALTVSRYYGFNGAVDAQVRLVGGTAQVIQDFVAGDVLVSWNNGQLGGRGVPVTIVNDTVFELSESFTVIVTSVNNPQVLIGQYNNVTVTILGPNDQSAGSLAFTPTAYTVAEEAGLVTLTVARLFGSDGAVSASYRLQDGSASNRTDYNLTMGTLFWASGDASSKTFTVNITDDSVYERAETFIALLFGPTGGASLLPGGNVATVTIAVSDQNAGNVTFGAPEVRVSETAGTVQIPVYRVNGTDGDVQVSYRSIAETATADVDYVAAAGTLTWLNADARVQYVPLTILDDSLFEMDEALTLVLESPTGGIALGVYPSERVIIAGPNDFTAGVISFAPNVYQVAEEAGRVTITVVRTGGTDGDVTARVFTSDISATAGLDYIAVNQTVLMRSGVGSVDFTVTILNDGVYEAASLFSLEVTTATGGAVITDTNARFATVVIDDSFDRKPGRLGFTCSAYTVGEGDGFAYISISRVNGSDGFASVSLTMRDGTAVSAPASDPAAKGDWDYVSVSPLAERTVNWTDGDASERVIAVRIIDDAVFEGIELFHVALFGAVGGVMDASRNDSVVYIEGPNDGDGALGLLATARVNRNKSAWEWVGPLMLALAVFFCLLVILLILLWIFYFRRSSPVVVDRHVLTTDARLRPAKETLYEQDSQEERMRADRKAAKKARKAAKKAKRSRAEDEYYGGGGGGDGDGYYGEAGEPPLYDDGGVDDYASPEPLGVVPGQGRGAAPARGPAQGYVSDEGLYYSEDASPSPGPAPEQDARRPAELRSPSP